MNHIAIIQAIRSMTLLLFIVEFALIIRTCIPCVLNNSTQAMEIVSIADYYVIVYRFNGKEWFYWLILIVAFGADCRRAACQQYAKEYWIGVWHQTLSVERDATT